MNRLSVRVLLFLVTLYLISFSVRFLFPVEEKPHLHENRVELEWEQKTIQFSYLEFGNQQTGSPILIFPDPFTNLTRLEPLAQRLSDQWKVLIPEFPTHSLDGERLSHSPASRASMAAAWLEATGIDSLHVAGYGFGNGTAIDFIDATRDNNFGVNSYVMMSALGVEEYHFLGYHVLNQPIYSLLYPIGIAVEYLLPIAGWYQFNTVDLERVRIMNSLDQREYRNILNSIEMPSQILHGKNDSHVSPETAIEHHRIIPQSELHLFEGGHLSVYENVEQWVREMAQFLQHVEQGQGVTRAQADTQRVEESNRSFRFEDVPPVHGWGLVLIILLLSSVTIVSEDLGCIGGGLLVAGGVIPLWVAFLTIYIGIILVDTFIYWIGRILGRPVIEKAPFRWLISKKDVDLSAEMFRDNGFKIIFASRFLPGTRFPTYFTAGLLKTNFRLFLLYFIVAITIWTPLLLGISIIAGQQMLEYLQIYQEYTIHIFVGLVIGLYLLFKIVLPLATKKGRREFAVRIIRMKQRLFGESN
ncbi:VTT domain-containing protein [Rhodohalobacter sp. SW132]|nr:VTT domain-containing protein [Rhodohalobacter sp. SW132]